MPPTLENLVHSAQCELTNSPALLSFPGLEEERALLCPEGSVSAGGNYRRQFRVEEEAGGKPRTPPPPEVEEGQAALPGHH